MARGNGVNHYELTYSVYGGTNRQLLEKKCRHQLGIRMQALGMGDYVPSFKVCNPNGNGFNITGTIKLKSRESLDSLKKALENAELDPSCIAES